MAKKPWRKRAAIAAFGAAAAFSGLEEVNRLSKEGSGRTKTVAKFVAKPYNAAKKKAAPLIKKFGWFVFLRGIIGVVGVATLRSKWKKRDRAEGESAEDYRETLQFRRTVLTGTGTTSMIFPKTAATAVGMTWLTSWAIKKWEGLDDATRTSAIERMRSMPRDITRAAARGVASATVRGATAARTRIRSPRRRRRDE